MGKKCIGREIEWETCGVSELDGRRYSFGCDEESFLLIWTAWSEVEGNKLKQIIYIITRVSSFHRNKTTPPSMLGALMSIGSSSCIWYSAARMYCYFINELTNLQLNAKITGVTQLAVANIN